MRKWFSLFMVLIVVLASMPSAYTAQAAETEENDIVIIDNGALGYSESTAGVSAWSDSGLKGYNGSSTRVAYAWDLSAYAKWTPSALSGSYRVSIYKIVNSSSDPSAEVEIQHGGQTDTALVDLQTGESGWSEIGVFAFTSDSGGEYVKLLPGTVGTYLRADAVKFEKVTETDPPEEVTLAVVDNGEAGYAESTAGNWTDSGLTGYNGSSTRVTYAWDLSAYAKWTPPPLSGTYLVSLYKIVNSASDPSAKIEVRHDGQTDTGHVNLQTGESGWSEVGAFSFDSGSGDEYVKLQSGTYGYSIRADAVKFEKVNATAALTLPSGSDEVPLDSELEIAFSTEMKADSLTGASMELKETATHTAVSVTKAVYADDIVLTPDTPLKADTSYTILLGDGLQLADGTPYIGNHAIVFHTVEGPPKDYLFVRPEQFSLHMGTWTFGTAAGSLSPKVLLGRTDGDSAATVPAQVQFAVTTPGEYRVWARTRDYSTNNPGSRYMQAGIDDGLMPKVLGQHGIDGFAWELVGEEELAAGSHTLNIADTSAFYARLDGIFITDDASYVPPNDFNELLNKSTLTVNMVDPFPEWAQTEAEPTSQTVIDNDKVKMRFSEVSTAEGTVIQQETLLEAEGGWIATNDRTDPFGYLLLGSEGVSTWMVFTSLEQVDDDTVRLHSENEWAKLTATWSVNPGKEDPEVAVELEAKQAGAYNLGMFNAPEQQLDDIDFLLLPFLYMSKRLPAAFELTPEQYVSTPVSLMTMPASGDQGKISYGIAVDPAEIPNRWAYADNSRFGLTIRGLDGGVRPGLFAPSFGSSEANLTVGQTYTFSYIPITRQGDWFEAYRHTVTDLFGLSDYRENVYGSMTDAVFNIQELLLDDDKSGWDPEAKAHYNMEGRNVVAQGAPLAEIEAYLLTEDPAFYSQRTIPTLEYLLTRGSMQFSDSTSQGGYISFNGELSPVGEPVSGFGTSVYGGAYAMTSGQVPLLRQIGIDDGVRAQPNSEQIPAWNEKLHMYLYTHDEQYLTEAKAGADAYIASKITAPQLVQPGDEAFINIAYSPYWQGLLDLYEATNEQKYLDAAEEGARRQMTSVWTNPGIPEGDMVVSADAIKQYPVMTPDWNGWWKGDVQSRLGYPEELDNMQDQIVPAWVPSRVGLGIEQKSTFNRSSNIIMSNWAPDLMRLSQYTGDSIYETYARNALIGRYTNYPGYYQNQFMVDQMKPDYPYTGPDMTNIYYHHIPVLLGLSIDFLASQAFNWSDGQIAFPSVRQQGYAYFSNKYYGFAPGSFFAEQEMWPWLKEGLITVDNVQADWIAARKDGRFAAALLNESEQAINVAISLGEEVTGPGCFNAAATVYDATGAASSVNVIDGELQLTIPAHGLVGFAVDAEAVQAPAFASVNSEGLQTSSLGTTVVDNGNTAEYGKGVVLQIDPNSYYAYVYTEFTPEEIDQATLHWKVGDGAWQTSEDAAYPFEFSTPVDDPSQPFTYYIEVAKGEDPAQFSPERTLLPLDGSD